MRRVFVVVMAFVMAFILPASTYALTEAQLDYYAQNNILFYNPSMTSGGCMMMAGGNNYDYDGNAIFSSANLNAIEANRPFYEKSAAEYNFPWQLLAVIHFREHSLLRDNPENGQGAYQLYSYTRISGTKDLDPKKAFLPAGPISDEEFQRQTDIVAGLIANSYGAGLDLNTDAGVKKMFFNYNGAAGVYIKQALALGFSQEEAESGEGSPYVMNRFDERRDPTVEPTKSNSTWGQIKKDGGSIVYPANSGYGAFTMYMALGGTSTYCVDGYLVSGGFASVEEANAAVMDGYKELAKEYVDMAYGTKVDVDGATLKTLCVEGPLANCVAFTKWFIARYTTAGNLGLPNGKDVVRTIAGQYGFSDIQSEPRPYAIFSRQSGGDGAGHTGVVLGIDEDNNKIIIGEAGCGAGVSWIGAHERKLSDYRTSDYTYVYTDAVLRGI